MSAVQALAHGLIQSVELSCNYSPLCRKACFKMTKMVPACRQYCVYGNKSNILQSMTRGLKGLYVHYKLKCNKNPWYLYCEKCLPFICTGGIGLICVHSQTFQKLNSGRNQAFCSRSDPVCPPSKGENTSLYNKLTLAEVLLRATQHLIRLFLRAVRLSLTFGPVLLLYPFALLSERFRQIWWDLFLFAVEISGPAFIKFGQWASTRRDLFSEQFCDKFSVLHHHARCHSWKYTVAKLKQAYGKDWRNIFIIFENNAKPVGSGCIAQVQIKKYIYMAR